MSKTDQYFLKCMCMSHVSKGTLFHEAANKIKPHVLIITYSKELWQCYLAIYQFHIDIHMHVFNDHFLLMYAQNKKSINLIISVFLCNNLITRQQLYMARNPQPAE